MKKRLWLVLLCGLLLVQTARPVAAEAAGTVYFVAAEENVLPISDSTMPFWSGGYLYISTSIFTGTTREILGISAINNTAKGMTVLEKDRRAILFDWSKDYAQEDNTGNTYQPGAIQRNGGVFVPAIVVADFF